MRRHFRIKTIAEFERDFGKFWREKVNGKFPERMDPILNMDITSLMDDKAKLVFDEKSPKTFKVLTLYKINGEKMYISYDMIKECTFGDKLKMILEI